MSAVIQAESLTKLYGRERGVVDLSFEVGPLALAFAAAARAVFASDRRDLAA